MEHIFTALIPIFLLILIGYYFKRIKFPSNDFWASADKLTYFVLMPSLLIYKLSTANLENIEAFDFVLTGILGIFAILIITLLINFKTKTTGAPFSSVVQGTVRFNTYVFLALIASMFGDEGIALAALLITFAIPLINVICITIFAIYVNDQKATFSGMIKSIVTNPLIVACVIGGSINYIDFTIPVIALNVLKILSASALPMGLLSVGFSLDLKSIKEAKSELVISSILKLLIKPICMYGIGIYFGLDTLFLSIVVVFAAMPTAPSAFVLARQLGGDIKLMASIITLQTIVSIFTISLILGFIVS
ncbi:AEC family transporter [Arcobacter sp. LA11]|uniref:AEC family transporter n=1 Tax=Arcobacter sp. LA11 TaxID=1898176 RepID=UPI000933BC66|nr:AEC family transporter [Arcobacter sp. LA11]